MSGIEFSITTKSCAGGKAPVVVLEQVQLLLTLRSDYRGALMGYLTSPQGTRVQVHFSCDLQASLHASVCTSCKAIAGGCLSSSGEYTTERVIYGPMLGFYRSEGYRCCTGV